MYDRYGEVETYKHLLWCCIESRKIWQLYNQFMVQMKCPSTEANDNSDVFIFEETEIISKVKIRVIQEMIQIIRLSRWTIENIKSILDGLDQIEKYNAPITGKNYILLMIGNELNGLIIM